MGATSDGPYIAIEGAIGVGKTTLARLLAGELGASLLLEVFEENPFLSDFYADRARYAFQTQVFFLLSRYRQQQRELGELLAEGAVISDYTFAKDRLFAHLNLQGDELATYEQLHRALAERIPLPQLIVYLYADVPVLLQRIAVRDRPYERGMDRDYIASLAEAYERFMASYDKGPVLRIDTNDLDVVRRPEHLAEVVGRVRAALGQGMAQAALPRSSQTAPTAAHVRGSPEMERAAPPTPEGEPPLRAALRLQAQLGAVAEALVRLDEGEGEAKASPALAQALRACLRETESLARSLGIDLHGGQP